jgi:hypothetical protein
MKFELLTKGFKPSGMSLPTPLINFITYIKSKYLAVSIILFAFSIIGLSIIFP